MFRLKLAASKRTLINECVRGEHQRHASRAHQPEACDVIALGEREQLNAAIFSTCAVAAALQLHYRLLSFPGEACCCCIIVTLQHMGAMA